jgi:hypothetical protein
MAHHSSNPFDDDAPDFIKKMFPEVAKEDYPGFGATNRFPQGKYTPQDEGEIAFGVAADKKAGKVIINFGKPTAWVGMDREQALALADSLKQKANDLLDISK